MKNSSKLFKYTIRVFTYKDFSKNLPTFLVCVCVCEYTLTVVSSFDWQKYNIYCGMNTKEDIFSQ